MKVGKLGLSFGDGSQIVFPMTSSISTAPFVLMGVDGLGPPPIDIAMSESLLESGSVGITRTQSRQISILLRLQPNYSIGEGPDDLRTTLYKLLAPFYGGSCRLFIYDAAGSTVQAYCDGYVSKMEPSIWSKDPMVQITFVSKTPYLLHYNWSNPSAGSVGTNPITINNPGSAPCGFRLVLTASAGALGNPWSLTDASGAKFEIGVNITIGLTLTIDTRYGSRMVSRSPITPTNLLTYVSANSTWLQLYPGVNLFTPSNGSFTVSSVTYLPRYWGI